MPLELQEVEDSDFEVYPDLMWSAFKDALMSVMYPNGYSQAAREHTARSTLEKAHKNAGVSVWRKVVDTDLPSNDPMRKIVSMAHWEFFTKERSEAELDAASAESQKEVDPPGLNQTFAEEFFGLLAKIRRERMGGKPYILLHILAVRPTHHRRGIGSTHLSWGSEKADELSLPMFLEASPMGRPLYERHGYRAVADVPLDMRNFGHEEELPHVCMLRPAKGEGEA